MSYFKCSVVIPLFENREYISRAVESVLAQTFPPLEVIVVDDGSTDGGGAAVEDVGGGAVKVFRQENRGVGAARNAGMMRACGDWIAFLDADDAWLPHHLEELNELRARFPSARMLGSSHVELSTAGRVQSELARSKVSRMREVDYFLEASKNVGFICASAVAVKREVFDRLGGFGTYRRGEDVEYWARIALVYPVAFSSRVTSIYYRGTGGVMENRADHHTSQKPVGGLEDVAPVLAMLCDKAREHPALWESSSIRGFVNGWLALFIKGCIYSGDIKRARQFKGLMIRPVDFRFKLWNLLASMPQPSLNILVELYTLKHKVPKVFKYFN